MDTTKARNIVNLIDEYSALLNAGSFVVCPVSGISFNLPSLTHIRGVYFESRHPLGISLNYPDILRARKSDLYTFSKMELAGIILTALQKYGTLTSSLSIFKQNEILRTACTEKELITFIDFLSCDFIGLKKIPAFRIEEDFKSVYLLSYEYTCFELKNDLVGKTLTVAEAIEQKVILVNGKETVRSMTSDIKKILHFEVAPFVSDDSYQKMEKAVALALIQPTDEMVNRVIDSIHKKLGRETETFAAEFKRYRAYFERASLCLAAKPELDLSFTSTPTNNTLQTNEESQHENNDQSKQPESETGNGKIESISERLARFRQNAGLVK